MYVNAVLQWSHAQTNVETFKRPNPFRGLVRFNGATLKRTWKPMEDALRQSDPASFNGATLKRTWKQYRPKPSEITICDATCE